ncbi:hypothetical protein [Halorubrum trueperi]|uniref:Uncharacterized protein n=1 Tax=Halorubrum trueperi TaxID=2004704 RepID=A0ABD5UPR3_9EURY
MEKSRPADGGSAGDRDAPDRAAATGNGATVARGQGERSPAETDGRAGGVADREGLRGNEIGRAPVRTVERRSTVDEGRSGGRIDTLRR